MFYKSLLSTSIASLAAAYLIGCSDMGNSPVAVGVNDKAAAVATSTRAYDIGVGKNYVWTVSTTTYPGSSSDYLLYRYNGSGWTQMVGAGRLIAVGGDGIAWVVNTANRVCWYDTIANWWQWPANRWTESNGIYDIGCDQIGNVYVVSGETDGQGNGAIQISRKGSSGNNPWRYLKDAAGNKIYASTVGGAMRSMASTDSTVWFSKYVGGTSYLYYFKNGVVSGPYRPSAATGAGAVASGQKDGYAYLVCGSAGTYRNNGPSSNTWTRLGSLVCNKIGGNRIVDASNNCWALNSDWIVKFWNGSSWIDK